MLSNDTHLITAIILADSNYSVISDIGERSGRRAVARRQISFAARAGEKRTDDNKSADKARGIIDIGFKLNRQRRAAARWRA